MQPGQFEVTLKLVVERGREMLVLRDRLTGLADLPGGRIATVERLAPWGYALRRELQEELGTAFRCSWQARPRIVFGHTMVSTGQPAIGMLFAGRYDRGEPVLSEEHDDLTWITAGTAPPWPFPPTLASALADYWTADTLARETN